MNEQLLDESLATELRNIKQARANLIVATRDAKLFLERLPYLDPLIAENERQRVGLALETALHALGFQD